MRRQLFLDCDGVLANFDGLAERILGEHPFGYEDRHTEEEFWGKLRDHGSFYRDLTVLPEGRVLFEAVKHLKPIILTGCPKGDWAAPQKTEWAAEHFPGTPIITCRSVDKRLHMERGDILVDDYLKYRDLWIKAGGEFVHFTGAEKAIADLAGLGLDVRGPRSIGALFNRGRVVNRGRVAEEVVKEQETADLFLA